MSMLDGSVIAVHNRNLTPFAWTVKIHNMPENVIRAKLQSISIWICLSLLPCPGLAEENWVYLGELQLPTTRATGKLSLNLGSLRSRKQHHEIWERIVFEPVRKSFALPSDNQPERLTLWAIRCRVGAMAKLTEGVANSFEPRPESPRFYVPSPASAGASIIETTCAEVRRRVSERRAMQDTETSKEKPAQRNNFDAPPSIFDTDEFDEGDD